MVEEKNHIEKMTDIALLEFFEEAIRRNDIKMILFCKAELISRLSSN